MLEAVPGEAAGSVANCAIAAGLKVVAAAAATSLHTV
jgi:hypothetical protein